MLRFIIRLDDACPTMNINGWNRIEKILDKYNIKPIVGVIPDNRDILFDWNLDSNFWNKVKMWQNKGWVIAQHGFNHVYHIKDGIHSEFVGLSYEEQFKKINEGYKFLQKRGINPTCFFAPAHTFDDTTIKVCKDTQYFTFISDGYALYPYKELGMLFVPSIFDTAHKILPFGVYTFILHPNFTTDKEFQHFEKFIQNNLKYFKSVEETLHIVNKERKRNIIELMIQPSISFLRKIRKIVKKVIK